MRRLVIVAISLAFNIPVAKAELTIREEQENGTTYPLKYHRFGGGGSQFIGNGVD